MSNPIVSGPWTKCSADLFDPDTEEKLRACESTCLTVLVESWDARDRLVVGEQVCDTCGARYGYTRRPTLEERRRDLADQAILYDARPAAPASTSTVPPRGFAPMFPPNTPLQLKGIYPRIENVDGESRKRVALEFFRQPFTRELANDLGVAGNLFKGTTGEPIDDIVSVKLAVSTQPQKMTIAATIDSEARMVVENVKIDPTISVRKDKEGPVFAMNMTVDFPYPTPDDLLFLFTNYTNQLSVTFEVQQGSLITEEEAAAQKPRRSRRVPATPVEPTTEPAGEAVSA